MSHHCLVDDCCTPAEKREVVSAIMDRVSGPGPDLDHIETDTLVAELIARGWRLKDASVPDFLALRDGTK